LVDVLGFSESVAYTHISVARKAVEFPEIIASGLSVSKLSRIVSSLTRENFAELIRFAAENTTAAIDREVARRNPRALRESVRPRAEDCFELKIKTSKDFTRKLERVKSLQAQRGIDEGTGAAIEAALDEYLRRHDPVEKAKRGRESKKLCLNRVRGRVPLKAAEKHAVFLRDGGRCTHVDHLGNRCGSDRWIQIHHLKPVSEGGGNDPANLSTLCAFHHDLAHQLNFPLEHHG
jgi:5-methylcytosine-specific restriction endonuclease McrA